MTDDRYEYLKKQLEQQLTFPTKYMFKFIVPKGKTELVKPLFENAEVSEKPSSKGTYVSLTVLVIVFSADEILLGYKKVKHIEGIIAL